MKRTAKNSLTISPAQIEALARDSNAQRTFRAALGKAKRRITHQRKHAAHEKRLIPAITALIRQNIFKTEDIADALNKSSLTTQNNFSFTLGGLNRVFTRHPPLATLRKQQRLRYKKTLRAEAKRLRAEGIRDFALLASTMNQAGFHSLNNNPLDACKLRNLLYTYD